MYGITSLILHFKVRLQVRGVQRMRKQLHEARRESRATSDKRPRVTRLESEL